MSYNPLFMDLPYLNLLRELRDKLITHGATDNRTTVTAAKVPGRMMRFDLSTGRIPMLTTKKLHLKSIVHELLWFISGDTNNETLRLNGVRIWNEWAIPFNEYNGHHAKFYKTVQREDMLYTKVAKENQLTYEAAKALVVRDYMERHEFIDEHNVPVEGFVFDEPHWETHLCKLFLREQIPTHGGHQNATMGDLGPLYGQQWRHFPAGDFFHNQSKQEQNAYVKSLPADMQITLQNKCAPINGNDYTVMLTREFLKDQGIDQLSQAVYLLKTSPNSRRNIVTAWNPQVVPSDLISPQDNVRQGRAALAACHTFFQFITEPLTEQERVALFKADCIKLEMISKFNEFEMGGDTAETLRQSNGQPYPTHRLNCTFYCRKENCGLVA